MSNVLLRTVPYSHNDPTRPNPMTEIRMTNLSALRGANFWSRRPVVRMDVDIGVFDDISSAEIRRGVDQLLAVLPGLATHRCNIGAPGGFVQRLREGTYAAHIIEHVAIELQSRIGHDVGYGRTRGTGNNGEYTVIFEYVHQSVGLRAAALALEIVQHAFSETLESVEHAMMELRALSATHDVPPLRQEVLCGITGSVGRDALRDVLCDKLDNSAGDKADSLIVTLPPMYILQAGLPYSHSTIAVILDTDITDVPERYRDPERAARLLTVVVDAVRPNGVIVCSSAAHYVHDRVRESGRNVVKFTASDDLAEHVARAAEQTLNALSDHDNILANECHVKSA